jgi:hypothetical protein
MHRTIFKIPHNLIRYIFFWGLSLSLSSARRMDHNIITHCYKLYFNIMPRPATESKESATQRVQRFFLGGKRLGSEVEHSPPSKAEVKKQWSYTSKPCYMPLWHGQGQICLFFANKSFEYLCVSELYM